ncbi:hypothetical protein MPER_08560, partial [Moniliophthora perniciosa FA553]
MAAALRCALRLKSLRTSIRLTTRSQRAFASVPQPTSLFSPLDQFPERHIGPDDAETAKMLNALGYSSMDAFVDDTVPSHIRIPKDVISNENIKALSEGELLGRAKELGALNGTKEKGKIKSLIGMGYWNAVVPGVIENPAWYTPYTPYQPEIAQGRLESLVNFQTMVTSLTMRSPMPHDNP